MAYKLLQTVKADAHKIVIPFKKYLLDNGLTVIIHSDTSNPLVHVDVTYHVGSGRESIGKSGFAHFFEHMMFEGSKNVGDNEHFKFISEAGGTLNGTTNRDRTNYFETVPKNQLETVLWLESDRMGFLLDAVTQKKFENQLSVIKNEKAQRYENQPYGMLGQISDENLYPENHPYSWTTIGYTEDLDRVTTDDLKAFFMDWYGPNNATLTIGGDVDADEAIQLVDKYFGPIKRGKEVEKPKLVPFELSEKRYVSYQDKVRFPMLQITLPTVPFYHEDEAALDILADIIGNGKNSFFYQNFEKTHKAVQAYSNHYCSEIAGEFKMGVFAYPGVSLKEAEVLIEQLLDQIAKNGIEQKVVERSKTKYYADMLYSLDSVRNKVGKLALYQTYLNTPDFIQRDAERYKTLTAEKVMEVFFKYIYKKPSVVVSFYDKGHEPLLPAADNHKFVRKEPKVLSHAPHIESPKIIDSFDRSKKPIAGQPPLVHVPNYYKEIFDNGLQLIGTINRKSPIVEMLLSFDAGSITDTVETKGRATFYARMFKESTQLTSGELIDDQLETLSSNVHASATKNKLKISVRCLKENVKDTLAIVKELFEKPAYLASELEQVKKEHIEMLAFQASQPDIMANREFNARLYGQNSALSWPTAGTASTIAALQADDLLAYKNEYLVPNAAHLVVSGDISADEVKEYWDFIINSPSKTKPEVKLTETSFNEQGKIYIVHKEDAAQSEIRAGYPSFTYSATGLYYKCQLMNYALGDAFNSRINLNLREDKGYTYGARSYFTGSKISGAYVAQAAVGADVTADALKELVYEITRYQAEGPNQDEWDFTQKSILYRDALNYETNRQKIGFLNKIADYQLEPSYIKEQQEILINMPVEEAKSLAKSYIQPSNLLFVIAGDKNKIYDSLVALNLGEVIIVEPETQIIE